MPQLKGSTVALWQSWDLNFQPSGFIAQNLWAGNEFSNYENDFENFVKSYENKSK